MQLNIRREYSASFDSQSLLCIVMVGDGCLLEKLRREELLACLAHLLAGAGKASLMTLSLQQTLCDYDWS